jgi:ribosome biogenesis GTPase
LERLTDQPHAASQLADNLENCGIVYKKTTGHYDVRLDGRILTCTLAARLRGPVDPISVGDRVRLAELPGAGAEITAILPRRNKFSRRSAVPMPTAHAHEQVLVANVDQVIPVFATANPTPKWNMLDRYLVSAEAEGIPALVCITKLDLAQRADGSIQPDLLAVAEEYRRAGYPVVLASAISGAGLDELRGALNGRISVLLGKSGVGKSTLLNALEPGLGLRVNTVNQVTGKGRHTTTGMEMIPLESGGAVVDTPGVQEFGLWDVDSDDLAYFYPEMRPFLGKCRFGLDCQHHEEPGCAVRRAVTGGEISPRRWQSYLHLKNLV